MKVKAVKPKALTVKTTVKAGPPMRIRDPN